MRMRALGFGEILDEIFRFYRRNFWLLVLLSLAPALPTLLLEIASGQANQFGFLGSLIGSLASSGAPQGQLPLPTVNLSLVLVDYVVTLVLVPFSIALVPRAAIGLAPGPPTGFTEAIRNTLRRHLRLLPAAVL